MMNQVLYDNILATSYLVMWVITFVWYHRKIRRLDSGSFIVAAYILYGVVSLLTLNDPLFSASYNPLKLFPYIYLYVMMMIALSPAIYMHNHPSDRIADPHTRILKFLGIVSIILALLMVPDIMSNFSSGLLKLFTDVDAGNDNYLEAASDNSDAGHKVRNLTGVLYNAISDLTVFLTFYFLTLKKRPTLLIIGMFFSTFIGLTIPIMNGQRGAVIRTVLTLIGTYMMFRQYLEKKINNIIQIGGLATIMALALPIGAITVSRFGNLNGGVFGFLNWYIGQGSLYFNNYGLDPGGCRYGDRTITLLKLCVDSSTPLNYTEQRDKNHNLEINDNLFTTFVGDFTIDFGPITAFFIFVIFFGLVVTQIRPRDGTIRLHQLLLFFFATCISVQGGMTLFTYSYLGNIKILTLVLLYAYLRYHDVLLERFPLTPIEDDSIKADKAEKETDQNS